MLTIQALRESRLLRYLVAAVVGACTDLGIFAALVYICDIHYLVAGLGSFVVSTLANYLVSVRLVFQSEARFPRLLELGMVYLVSATGLAWHQLILFLLVERADIHLMFAKMTAIGCVFFWNYFLRRNYVFAPRR